MLRTLVGALLLAVSLAASLLVADSVSALGLKVAPLEYKTDLQKGERKQGFIDISNPSHQAVKVRVSVQAFRQINNEGGLQFYDDKQIQLGIKPGLADFELGPREAIRMSFVLDGSNLPKGDVYAALFLTTDVKQPQNGVGQLVRVGTILSIVNDSKGERKAEITGVTLPFLQLGDNVQGSYKVRNTGSANTGFYPTATISGWPSTAAIQHQSSLVFGGRERSNNFTYQASVGFNFVQVGYGTTKQGQWVLVLPAWLLVVLLLIIVIIWVECMLYQKRRRHSKNLKSKVKPSTSNT